MRVGWLLLQPASLWEDLLAAPFAAYRNVVRRADRYGATESVALMVVSLSLESRPTAGPASAKRGEQLVDLSAGPAIG